MYRSRYELQKHNLTTTAWTSQFGIHSHHGPNPIVTQIYKTKKFTLPKIKSYCKIERKSEKKENKMNTRVCISEGNSKARRTLGFATLMVTMKSSILLKKYRNFIPFFKTIKGKLEMNRLTRNVSSKELYLSTVTPYKFFVQRNFPLQTLHGKYILHKSLLKILANKELGIKVFLYL